MVAEEVMNGKFENPIELGARIRAERESLGLSIEDVQERTKIRAKYLKAIEAGDDKITPGKAYFGVFIKTYAEFLGLDGLEFSRLYKEMTEPGKAYKLPTVEPPRERPPSLSGGKRRRPRRKKGASKEMRLLFTLILIAAVLWGAARLLSGYFDRAQDPNGTSAVAKGDGGGGEDLEPTDILEEIPVASVKVERSDPSEEVTLFRINETPLEVDIETRAAEDTKCWIQAKADGETVVEKTLGPGEKVHIKAQNEVAVRAGKPWLLTLVLNGQDLGVGGLYGPVKDIIFRYDGEI